MFRDREAFRNSVNLGPVQYDGARLGTTGGDTPGGGTGGSVSEKVLQLSVVGLLDHDPAEPLLRWTLTDIWTFSTVTGVANADFASSGTRVFLLKNNGVTQGTITFTGSSTGVVAFTDPVFDDPEFELWPPVVTDATLDRVSITLTFTPS